MEGDRGGVFVELFVRGKPESDVSRLAGWCSVAAGMMTFGPSGSVCIRLCVRLFRTCSVLVDSSVLAVLTQIILEN